jgi:hypothetical protein
MPMLSIYAMKNTVPEKRYVGALSPQVENYASHSVITNSWCVQAKLDLDPGDVYSLITVMAEPITHEIPLTLQVFYPAELEQPTVIIKPLSAAAEYYCVPLRGVTDAGGSLSVELTPLVDSGSVQVVP